ncbi:MAG: hypothetical protein PHQ43_11605 [Dehalococcoidales bacterium]|nr:hypothetical protein [Dehalococcoidales bacterium]
MDELTYGRIIMFCPPDSCETLSVYVHEAYVSVEYYDDTNDPSRSFNLTYLQASALLYMLRHLGVEETVNEIDTEV